MDRALIADALIEAAPRPWALQADRLGVITSLIRDFTLGNEVADYRLARMAGVNDLSRALSAEPEIISGRDGRSVAIVSLKGVVLFDVQFPPIAFSSRQLAQTMRELAADKQINAIILDIAYPGGSVAGIEEAADEIFCARQVKPVIAAINPFAGSAAYHLASQASQIIVTPSGDLGSVGVYALHLDQSAAMEMAGFKATFASAGKHKIEGNAFEPLTAEAKAAIQADVDTFYDGFIKAVARGRGVGVGAVRAGFGQGRMVLAREAVRLGMADKIGTIDQALPQVLGSIGRGRAILLAPRATLSEKDRQLAVRRRRQKLWKMS